MQDQIYNMYDNSGKEKKDFVAEGELTVTITINEYRELVSKNATREQAINKAEKDKWTRNCKINELEEENARLKAELYELKKQLDNTNEPEQETQTEDIESEEK